VQTNVLLEDLELADCVPEPDRELALRAAVTATMLVSPGIWEARSDAHRTAGGFGLLVLEGLLVRRVEFANRVGAELLGAGDLVRPQEHDGEEATLSFAATWRVLTPVRFALLDRRWSVRMSRFPDVGVELSARALRRARRLANMFTVALHPKLDERLHLLLWELADRYGRVHMDGVHVDIPLTHEIMSHLVGAQRPSVSSSLSRLADRGLIERTDLGWCLHGDPPA
jgi:CRP-like cAMP-binding protein